MSRGLMGVLVIGFCVAAWAAFKEPSKPAQPTNQLPLDASAAATMTRLIRQFGFNCPAAKLAFGEGQDAYGTVMKVHCGPAERSGVYENAVFRVTVREDNRYLVKPWQ